VISREIKMSGMTKNFSRFLLVLLSLIASSVVFGQPELLKNYRFEDGGYQFVGIFAHMDDHPLQKKLGEFYTDDISVLNAIKKAWVFRKPQNRFACGYHYYIMIVRNGVEVETFAVNLECHELAAKDRSFYFDFDKLTTFASRLKPLYRSKITFDTTAKARNYWDQIHSDKDFVYANEPAWLNFDGEFRFSVKCPTEKAFCLEQGKEMRSKIESEISVAYPGERFRLEPSGGSSNGELFMTIACNKTLEDRFVLYDRWGKVGLGGWTPYPIYLYSYWKTKQ
jgi:hypothetical protein